MANLKSILVFGIISTYLNEYSVKDFTKGWKGIAVAIFQLKLPGKVLLYFDEKT